MSFSRFPLLGLVFLLSLCGLLPSGCTSGPPAHGIAFVVTLDTKNSEKALYVSQALEQTRAVLSMRLKQAGFRHYGVELQDENSLVVKLPPLSDQERGVARKIIAIPGVLQFRFVHPDSYSLIEMGIVEPGYEILSRQERDEQGQLRTVKFLVAKKPAGGLTGKNVTHVSVERDPMGRLIISFELDNEGAKIFAKLSRENIGRQLAIVLDGELRSAPVIKSEIPGGRGQIDGGSKGFTADEALELSTVLQNPLEVPLQISKETEF